MPPSSCFRSTLAGSLRSFVPRLVLLASSPAWIAACSKYGEHHGAAEPPATGARTTNSVSAQRPPDDETVPRDPREPDWERDSVVLQVELDTSLAARAQDALLLPPESAGGLSFTQDPEHRFGSFTRSSERELRVQLGRSDGFTGSEVELRLASTPKGELTCRALASNFWDAGPPFSGPWTGVTGRVRVSSLAWTPGETVYVAFDLDGKYGERATNQSCFLELVLP